MVHARVRVMRQQGGSAGANLRDWIWQIEAKEWYDDDHFSVLFGGENPRLSVSHLCIWIVSQCLFIFYSPALNGSTVRSTITLSSSVARMQGRMTSGHAFHHGPSFVRFWGFLSIGIRPCPYRRASADAPDASRSTTVSLENNGHHGKTTDLKRWHFRSISSIVVIVVVVVSFSFFGYGDVVIVCGLPSVGVINESSAYGCYARPCAWM